MNTRIITVLLSALLSSPMWGMGSAFTAPPGGKEEEEMVRIQFKHFPQKKQMSVKKHDRHSEKDDQRPQRSSDIVPPLAPPTVPPSAPPPSPISSVQPPSWPIKKIALSAIATAAVIGALYAGLKLYQRRRIMSTLRHYDLKITMLSPTQKNLLAAALRAGYGFQGSMQTLQHLAKRDVGSANVSAPLMWQMIADLYYRTKATEEQINELKDRIAAYQPAL